MENKNILAAVNGYLVNDQEEILLLREKGGKIFLALATTIKLDSSPLESLIDKSKKELK